MAESARRVPDYEGIDSMDGFPNRASLDQYRSGLLDKTTEQVDFIRRQFGRIDCVAESCCGNGRLLVALANDCEKVWGYDIARSRIDFAQAWLNDNAIENMSVFAGDLFSLDRSEFPDADLAVCITGAFGYFGALPIEDTKLAVGKLADLVKSGGDLLLEFYQHGEEVRMCLDRPDNGWKVWHELPQEDRFRYYLSDLAYDPVRKILTHKKTFIGRKGEIDDGRQEALRIFEPAEIAELFGVSFEDFQFFSGWNGQTYDDDGKNLIVTAKRKR